jgi:hypothetical protein
MELCMVVRGTEQWYCPSDQAEMWAEQGCTVYELTPTKVAGPDPETSRSVDGSITAKAIVETVESATPMGGGPN